MHTFRILAASALILTAGATMAQATRRNFSYKSIDAFRQNLSGTENPHLRLRTKVTVSPFIYVQGNLGAEWTVDGWGVGADSKAESIRFFHSDTLTFDLEDFANPKKVSGTNEGATSVDLRAELSIFNDRAAKKIFGSGLIPASQLNAMFSESGPHFTVDLTGGLMRLDFNRKISINASVGPGTYENTGRIKVIRN